LVLCLNNVEKVYLYVMVEQKGFWVSLKKILSFSSVQCEKIWGIMVWLSYSTRAHYICCNTQLALSHSIFLFCHNYATISWTNTCLVTLFCIKFCIYFPSIIFNSIIQISYSILPNLPCEVKIVSYLYVFSTECLTQFHCVIALLFYLYLGLNMILSFNI